MKPLLIGEAPGPNGDQALPFEGRPATQLLEFMGFRSGEREHAVAGPKIREMFLCRNLIERPLSRLEGSKGTEWPVEEARLSARKLAMLIERGQNVILLGKRVAAAFSAPEVYWSWSENPDFHTRWAIIPHPSGIVRLYNEPHNRVRSGIILWEALGKL